MKDFPLITAMQLQEEGSRSAGKGYICLQVPLK